MSVRTAGNTRALRRRSPEIMRPHGYRNGVRLIWEQRAVLRTFASRDLHRKYRNFRLGYLWTILEPLGMTLVLWFVFQYILGARKFGEQPYFLFLSVAILPWWWFTKGISASTRVFVRDTGPLRISLLPTQIWVLRGVIVSMAEFLMSLPIIVFAVLVTWTFPGPLILLFPVAIAIQFVLMYALGLLVASISAVVPDFARIVRIVTRAMFYLTPVLYSIARIPDSIRDVAPLNPLVGILGLYRIGFWPEETETAQQFAMSFAVCAVLVIAGLVVFRRIEPRILKEA